jgi:hypothetical protein
VAGGATLVALTTFGGNGIGAQPLPDLQVTPPSGPPGTTITVSGSGCPPDAIPNPDPEFDTDEQAQVWFVDSEENPVSDFFSAPVAGADGNWSVQVVVPDVPLGTTLGIRAQCEGDSAFAVGSASFGVEAVQPPPTTPTSAPPNTDGSSSGTGAGSGSGTAPAATPVRGVEPTFTG